MKRLNLIKIVEIEGSYKLSSSNSMSLTPKVYTNDVRKAVERLGYKAGDFVKYTLTIREKGK